MAGKEQLKKALQQPYNRSLLATDVLQPVFGRRFELLAHPEPVADALTKTENRVIQDALRYGHITLDDDTPVNCYEIHLQPQVDISINKVSVQQYIRKLTFEGEAALINFVAAENSDLWRMTLVTRDKDFNEAGEEVDVSTHQKRYTFLLGPAESCLTAAERLEVLEQKETLDIDNFRDAFSVERLSKEFFREYKQNYEQLVEILRESNFYVSAFNNQDKTVRDFVKKLLGRLVFLYFVQKKGWLGASDDQYTDGNTNFLTHLFHASGGDDSFFPVWLDTLFFNTLNNPEKEGNFTMPDGQTVKVPFLNGGLFDRDATDTKEIVVPAYFFHNPDNSDAPDERGFLDFLNAYNFTVYEDSPEDHTIAVDPEMLGHIFENLLEDNKDKGAFYTPKQIVHYMCQESLTEYLRTHANKIPGLQNEASLDKLVKEKDDEAFNTKQLNKVQELLNNVTIADPAIGSGAFPMGLLQEIQGIMEIIAYKTGQEWNAARTKENIIQHSIYGVDIEKGAVDIARLRFWLSLIVDEDQPRPLPNLDYKIMQGNSLLESFEGIDLSRLADDNIKVVNPQRDLFGNIADGQAEITFDKAGTASKIKQLQDKYFRAESPEEKDTIRQDIEQLVYEHIEYNIDLQRHSLERRIKEAEEAKGPGNLSKSGKKKLDNLKQELRHIDEKEAKLEKSRKSNSKNYFLWHLFFKDVFDTGGFDIIIGNPPYVRADNEEFAEQREMITKSKEFETLYEKWDLMVPFIEKGLKLMNQKHGTFSFIVSDSITTSKFAYKIQDWIIGNYHLKSIDYFNNMKVFGASVNPVILKILANSTSYTTQKIIRQESFHNKEITELDIQNTAKDDIRAKIFRKEHSSLFIPHFKTERLGNICYLSYGLRPNSDEKKWKGEFTKDDIISNVPNDNFSKKYIEGKDIKRYRIDRIRYLEWKTERVPKKLVRPTFTELYEGEKLIIGSQTSGTYDNTGIVSNHSTTVMKLFADLKGIEYRSITTSISKNNLDKEDKKKTGKVKKIAINKKRAELEQLSTNYRLKYILAIINSTYAIEYLNNFRRHRLEYYFYPDDFRKLPIPVVSEKNQQYLEEKVDQILSTKSSGKDTTSLEREIDVMVFKLYGLTYDEVLTVEPEFWLSKEEYEAKALN